MTSAPVRITVITGSRAEFGLLTPAISALRAHPTFETRIIACGAHLLAPSHTINEVRAAFGVDSEIPMQRGGEAGRLADAGALGRGVEGIARALGEHKPHWVIVLGDRIEAFAGAIAASIGGFALAHIHGGDRAEGIADEAMRHAITKLAHLHLAASEQSAQRIIRMGESPDRVHIVGSPAIDGLSAVRPMTDREAAELGDPAIVVLIHPSGLNDDTERALTRHTLEAVQAESHARSALCLAPNSDPGREAVLAELTAAANRYNWPLIDHLPRPRFLALLKRLAKSEGGLLVGNSSAGLIECAALQLPVVNVGPRQTGRERPDNVIDAPAKSVADVREAIHRARLIARPALSHPFGDGSSGERIAATIARIGVLEPHRLRKRCAY